MEKLLKFCFPSFGAEYAWDHIFNKDAKTKKPSLEDFYINSEDRAAQKLSKLYCSVDGKVKDWGEKAGWNENDCFHYMLAKRDPLSDFLYTPPGALKRILTNHMKFLVLSALVFSAIGGGSKAEAKVEDSVGSAEPGLVGSSSIELNDKKYQVKVFKDGGIEINGRRWHLKGLGKYCAVKFEVKRFVFDPISESLEFGVKGSLLFVIDKEVNKTFSRDQVLRVLPLLSESDQPFSTPQMREQGIELAPGKA